MKERENHPWPSSHTCYVHRGMSVDMDKINSGEVAVGILCQSVATLEQTLQSVKAGTCLLQACKED